MLHFDPKNPFPSVDPELVDLRQAALHSAQVDLHFGIPVEEAEAALLERFTREAPKGTDPKDFWIGLPPHALLTPYSELRYIFEKLSLTPESHLVMLGAGYARAVLVLEAHYPGTRFTGYEWMKERFFAARTMLERRRSAGFTSATLLLEDLSEPGLSLARGTHYFLYDFSHREAIESVLARLREIARESSIQVIARGRRVRDLIERREPWLAEVNSPRHFKNFSIYKSA